MVVVGGCAQRAGQKQNLRRRARGRPLLPHATTTPAPNDSKPRPRFAKLKRLRKRPPRALRRRTP